MHNIFRHIANAFRTPAPSLRGRARGEAKLKKGLSRLRQTLINYLFILDEYIYGLSNSRLIQISSYATTNMYERFVSCCKSTHFF
jgi:hypothetical protein